MHMPRTFRGKIALILAICFACLLADAAWYLFLPKVAWLKSHNPGETSFMKYREHCWKAEGRKKIIRRQWVPYGRISPFIARAVVAGEDAKFWHHKGFDLTAIRFAVMKDIKLGKFALGGSTISQQLAKNLYFSPSRNPLRKINEAILTWRLERTLSKRRIIELYLNVVEWGDGIFGIEAASQHYYGCPAAQLGPHEAAQLASVLPNPVRFRPNSDMRYVVRRSRLIYAIMVGRHPAGEQGKAVPKTPVIDSTRGAPVPIAPGETAPDTITTQDIDALLDSLAK